MRDYFKELGIRPFINAAGTYTALTSSLMPPEVISAMEYASRHFVRLEELSTAAGRRIAELLDCESAMVTSGAAGALTIGTAACITGANAAAIRQLPDLTGLKNEVLIQKAHRYEYQHAVSATGARFVEIETAAGFRRAASPRTAMALFFNAAEPAGQIESREWVALARNHGIVTFNDAAADVPPLENLTHYVKMGFDLVTFSGGKALRGPQGAGLLLGRRDLIEAARLNTAPHDATIGRGMKVTKEEILGMLVALELYLAADHAAEFREYERRAALITAELSSIPGVRVETYIPPIANHVPHLKIAWPGPPTPPAVADALREGDPSIEVNPNTDVNALHLGVWMLRDGEAEQVAARLRVLLLRAPKPEI